MTLKQTLAQYIKDTRVKPPFSYKKVIKQGHNPTTFLLGLKTALLKADDIKTTHAKESLSNFIDCCENLMSDD